MPVPKPDPSRQMRLRALIEERNRVNQQIRDLYDKLHKIDQEIAEVRLDLRRRS